MCHRLRRVLLLCAVLVMCGSSVAFGETVAGLTFDGGLVIFDTATPSIATLRTIGPLTVTGEALIGIDFRPATGQLYGISSDGVTTTRTYLIDPVTGTATLVGSANVGLSLIEQYGMDFNPVNDRLRIVNTTLGNNLRVDPTSGALAGTDVALSSMQVTAVAYDRNVTGTPQTTLYAIDRGASSLATIGDINGTPSSPNGGVVTSVGPLGVTIDAGTDAGFDVSPTGVAYASLSVGGATRLFTINLATGAATFVGTLPVTFQEIAIVPALPSGPTPPSPDTTRPSVLINSVTSAKLGKVRTAGLVVRFSCSEACSVTATMIGKRKRLGTAAVALDAAGVGRVRIRLSALGKHALRRTKRLAVQVVVVAKDRAGNKRTVKARVLLIR
jgi:hypothetical protein